MSKVTLTAWEKCGVSINPNFSCKPLILCTEHQYHNGLLPFFYDNVGFLALYDAILQDRTQPDERKRIVGKPQECYEKNSHTYTSFHCNGLPQTSTWDMVETEWTWRLYYSLPQFLPLEANAQCLCDKGEKFNDFQSKYSQLAFSQMYYFQGAPDIVIMHANVIMHDKKKVPRDVLCDDIDSSESVNY